MSKAISPDLGIPKKANLSITAPIIASVADAILNPPPPRKVVIKHKKRSKSGVTYKQPKTGKNKPAKNYNPETKTWEK
jgi:hypothetical protein